MDQRVEKVYRQARDASPLKRHAGPEAVAHAILGLGVTNSFIAGHTLVVNGGRTLV